LTKRLRGKAALPLQFANELGFPTGEDPETDLESKDDEVDRASEEEDSP
jgi:hypothetical protein